MEDYELEELERLLRKLYAKIGVTLGENSHYDATLKIADGRIVSFNCTPKGKP